MTYHIICVNCLSGINDSYTMHEYCPHCGKRIREKENK